jgi:hypothetical protein
MEDVVFVGHQNSLSNPLVAGLVMSAAFLGGVKLYLDARKVEPRLESGNVVNISISGVEACEDANAKEMQSTLLYELDIAPKAADSFQDGSIDTAVEVSAT